MRQIVLDTPGFRWLDVVAPTPEELSALAGEYGIHPLAVQDCLDPDHLPKYERIGPITFVLLRAYDETAPPDADTVHQITRKVALFFNDQILITVHRAEQRFLEELKTQLAETAAKAKPRTEAVVVAIANGVIDTYWKPIDEIESRIDASDIHVAGCRKGPDFVHKCFHLKRRINAIRSTSRHIMETVKKLAAGSAGETAPGPRLNDLRENAESLYFATDEILEDANSLLSLTLAAADHQTNEVVKVLTIFSAFFLPLTFIVGVYGMNFDYMPELRSHFGYPGVMLLMAGISAGIWLWFRRKGWL
jgi:magnesium transporter